MKFGANNFSDFVISASLLYVPHKALKLSKQLGHLLGEIRYSSPQKEKPGLENKRGSYMEHIHKKTSLRQINEN